MSATDTKVPEVKKSDTITCDLHNPTRADRIIYDGIPGSMRQVVVGKGETKRGVTISKVIADELRARNKSKRDSDLVVRPQSTDAEESAAA